jgi:hypothetical protein
MRFGFYPEDLHTIAIGNGLTRRRHWAEIAVLSAVPS